MEVEALSKRCRSSESAFVEMTNLLSVTPQTSVEQGSDTAEEIRSLRTEVKDLERELSKMKNQDLTVRQQASKIKELEAQKVNNMSVMESEYAKKRDEIEMSYSMKLEKLKTELQQMKSKTKSLEGEIEHLNSLRFEEKNKADQLFLSKQEEVNQLMNQVESLEVRVSVGNISNSGTLDLYKDMLAQNEARIHALEQDLIQERRGFDVDQAVIRKELEMSLDQNKKLEAECESFASVMDSLKTVIEKSFPGKEVADSRLLVEAISEGASALSSEIDSMKIRLGDLSTERNRLAQEAQCKDERIEQLLQQSLQSTNEQFSITQVPPGSDEVVAIIQAQRDRFRTRVLELEAERDALKNAQQDMSNKLNAVYSERRKIEAERNFWKAHNTDEKIKSPGDVELGAFAQSHAPPSLASVKRRMTGAQSGGMHEVEHTLTSMLVWGLGNPLTRRAALMYLITLHLLVFLVLYRISSIVSS